MALPWVLKTSSILVPRGQKAKNSNGSLDVIITSVTPASTPWPMASILWVYGLASSTSSSVKTVTLLFQEGNGIKYTIGRFQTC